MELSTLYIDDLQSMAKELGFEYDILSENMSNIMREAALRRFKPFVSVHLSIGYYDVLLPTETNISTFSHRYIKNEPAYIFMDDNNYSKLVFELKDGSKISDLLDKCYSFECFITNKSFEWFIALNQYVIEIAYKTIYERGDVVVTRQKRYYM